ncbi:MAG TPA: septum formation initiator family protein [Flavitalea sp.]|nr:septum formation initiator family protein [Flavitalea sp.]
MKKLNFIPGWLKNKYFLTAFGFAVWMIFFDQQDLITTQVKQRNELNSLKASRDYYKQEIEATRLELEQLKSDPAVLEKYAREKYRMKRDNEDVFIVSDSLR